MVKEASKKMQQGKDDAEWKVEKERKRRDREPKVSTDAVDVQ